LVSQYLERISRDAMRDHQDLIREFVRDRHGVYALYRGTTLRYVGLASDLSVRLKAHLNDRHADSWDRFSVYLIIGDGHIKELESLILRIVRPKDNRQGGKFANSEDLSVRFKRGVREHHRRQIAALFGENHAASEDQSADAKAGPIPVLAPFILGPMKLRARHKGKLITATVRRGGSIRFASKVYGSPSGAATAACRRPCDGWTFWTFERAPGDWVRLDVLRRAAPARRQVPNRSRR